MWWKPWTWHQRLLRSVTTRESEFNDDDYALIMGYSRYEQDVHPACGHLISETTSMLADRSNPNGAYYYEAELPIRCHACTAAELKQKEYDFDSSRMWVVNKVMR